MQQQGCTNLERQLTRASKVLRLRLICGFSVWNLDYVALLAPKMLELAPRIKKNYDSEVVITFRNA
jgi:hypothetical protein